MGYQNVHSLSYQIERALDYNIHSHGDAGAFHNSVSNADLPAYTAMFYQASQHESFSEFKYDKIQINYDVGLADTREAMKGAPMEAYIPVSAVVPDGAGKDVVVRDPQVVLQKEIIDEISKAQAEILGSGDVFIRTTEIEQELHLKRTIRKVEIFKKPRLLQ